MSIRDNADKILYQYGLRKKLEEYGTVHIVGSYNMNLMTWNDLDINIECREQSYNRIFSISNDINQILKPYRFEGMCSDNDRESFYGCETAVTGEPWNIDIWFKHKNKIMESQKKCEEIIEYITLNPSVKDIIIDIKLKLIEQRLYGINKLSNRHYHSIEIYNAVQKEGIKSFSDFIEKYPK